MKTLAMVLAMAFTAAGFSPAQAEVKTEVVEYRHGDVVLEGYLAYDASLSGKRPGVLVIHEWMGHNPYVRKRAEQLAGLGYVAFALDMYGKVLALHGGDDPNVPPKQVDAFQEEMRKAGVDWQFVSYGGAVHAFTNPGAGSDNSKGAAYNERADRRSWEAMKTFFAETLK